MRDPTKEELRQMKPVTWAETFALNERGVIDGRPETDEEWEARRANVQLRVAWRGRAADSPEDLLNRLDALRRWLLNQRDAAKTHTDPILREQAELIIDGHLVAVDDACEALQLPK